MPALPESWSLEVLRDYLRDVDAGCGALEDEKDAEVGKKGAQVQKKVVAMIADVDAKIRERDASRQVTRRRRAVVRVKDALFDAAIGHFSGLAFLAAGKDRNAEPYETLFGTITAEDVKDMGPGRASSIGQDLVIKATSQQHPLLVPVLPSFESRVKGLETAGAERDAAARAELPHEIARGEALVAAEKATADWELDLRNALRGVPGAKEIVRAILALPRDEKPATKAPVPAPVPAPPQ